MSRHVPRRKSLNRQLYPPGDIYSDFKNRYITSIQGEIISKYEEKFDNDDVYTNLSLNSQQPMSQN